jgi:glucose/arabinose dehydrogenase
MLGALLLAAAPSLGSATEPVDVRLLSKPVVGGLNLPTTLAEAPDGRVFIGEKAGRVLEWRPGDTTTRTVIDLSPAGADIVQGDQDRGLLGLAVDPGFDDPASPGFRRLYVSFQSRFGPVGESGANGPLQPAQGCSLSLCPTVGWLSAVQVDDLTQATGAQMISQNWCGEQPAHAIGALQWSKDRKALLVTAGDGIFSGAPGAWDEIGNPCSFAAGFDGLMKPQQAFGNVTEPGFEGAVVSFPLEKLRDPARPVTPRIVAGGLRNPWRMAVDDATGDAFVADVGWNTYEELNRIPAASVASGPPVNYGWPCAEGPNAFEVPGWSATAYCRSARASGALRPPWLHYGNAEGPTAIVSCSDGRAVGPVAMIRDDAPLPAGLGSGLFFADYARGCGWIAPRGAGTTITSGDIRLVSDSMPFITDALQTADGTFHWLQILSDDLAGPGGLNRLATGVVAHIDITHAPHAGGTATASAARSESSLADPSLSYEWDFDGDGVFHDARGPDARMRIDEPRTISVRVTDQLGRSDISSAEARIGTPPVVTIHAEPAASVVPASTRVRASVSVEDIDGDASADTTRWSVQMEHCQATCHTHHVLSHEGASISFTAEPHAEEGAPGDTYVYRVIARNTDRAGLVGVASRDIRVADPDYVTGQSSPPEPSVGSTETEAVSPSLACPAPGSSPPERQGARAVRLSAGQLLINQRISQAAVRRVNALADRLDGRPVTPPSPRPAGRVTLSVKQLRINQRISQAAVRRVNALTARIEGRPVPGSSGNNAPGTLTLSATQLLINQRISQAAIRRINALEQCLVSAGS